MGDGFNFIASVTLKLSLFETILIKNHQIIWNHFKSNLTTQNLNPFENQMLNFCFRLSG